VKAYVIANIDVRDPERYQDYVKLTPGSIAPFNGRLIAWGGHAEKLEGVTLIGKGAPHGDQRRLPPVVGGRMGSRGCLDLRLWVGVPRLMLEFAPGHLPLPCGRRYPTGAGVGRPVGD